MKTTKHNIAAFLISTFLNGLAAYIVDAELGRFLVAATLIILAIRIQDALVELK